MEMSQGNSLNSYLKQIKMSVCFLLNWKTGGQNRSYLGSWYQWEGESSANIMYINGKMSPVETISGIGAGIKENDGWGKFTCDVLDIL
jgi:hypothetical protein